MKRFIFFARVSMGLISVLPCALTAQDLDVYPNYVMIGAFAHHQNAVNFTREANENKFQAKFQMNPHRNLYYVYVLTTENRNLAIDEALKLRKTTKYFDSWVFSGFLGELSADTPARPGLDINPLTRETQPVSPGRNIASNNLSPLNPGTQKANSPAQQNRNLSDQHTPTPVPEKNSVVETRQSTDVSQSAGRAGAAQKDAGLPDGKNSTSTRGNMPQTSGSHPDDETGRRNTSALHPEKTALLNNDESPSQNGKGSPVQDADGPLVQNKAGSPRQEGDATLGAGNADSGGVSADEVIRDKPLATAREGSTVRIEDKSGLQEVEENGATRKEDVLVTVENRSAVMGPPPTRTTTAPLEAEDVVGKNFYFYLFRADNLKQIGGEVDAIDFERSRKMATYPANQSVTVRMPSGKLQQVSFICQVFGYRKQQKEFDPNNPDADLYLDDSGNLVVPFELVRLQKGDIAIMYNVFFFKDAAVMRPESRYEVNNLLELLKENPTYKIMIHGHTNGNANGKIISMDKAGNFYSLTGTKQGFGSARKLSEERANVIREFLISSGIPENRMEVKAWGGKKPIHDKHSVRANENVRVEIEILTD